MGDISSGISPVGGNLPRPQATSLTTSQPLRGDGAIQEATSGTTTGRVTENASVTSSRTTLSITSQQSQPQSAIDFGMILLLSSLLSDDEDKNKSNPFLLLVGFALLSQLQQQSSGSQGAQFLQFDSQSLEISQSVAATESTSSQSATYQQTSGVETGTSLGGSIDVTG